MELGKQSSGDLRNRLTTVITFSDSASMVSRLPFMISYPALQDMNLEKSPRSHKLMIKFIAMLRKLFANSSESVADEGKSNEVAKTCGEADDRIPGVRI